MISLWFKGKEMAFAIGLNLSISSLGSVINGITVPQVFDKSGLGAALGVGFIVCIFSLLNALGISFLDRRAELKNKKNGVESGTEQEQGQ